MKPKRKNGESVSPVIATILMVAITVVLSAVLYVIVSDMLRMGEPPKTIGIACNGVGPANAKCTIANADNGVDFTQIAVQVRASGGILVASWAAGFSLASGPKENDSASAPVLSGRVVDNGDGRFGVGDDVYLVPIAGSSLAGLTIKMSGGKADGFATVR